MDQTIPYRIWESDGSIIGAPNVSFTFSKHCSVSKMTATKRWLGSKIENKFRIFPPRKTGVQCFVREDPTPGILLTWVRSAVYSWEIWIYGRQKEQQQTRRPRTCVIWAAKKITHKIRILDPSLGTRCRRCDSEMYKNLFVYSVAFIGMCNFCHCIWVFIFYFISIVHYVISQLSACTSDTCILKEQSINCNSSSWRNWQQAKP